MSFNIGDRVVVGPTPYDEPDTPEAFRMEGKNGTVKAIENPGGTTLYMVELDGRDNPLGAYGDANDKGWSFWTEELTKING